MSKLAMEVALAAVDASNLLKGISETILPMAIEEHPCLAVKLQSYRVEISKAERVVNLVRNQKGLQTSGIVAGIRMLQTHGEMLKDKTEFEKNVEKFRSERKRLIEYIRLASVGLTKTDGAFIVDTNVVKLTDEAVKKVLGKELGLHIAIFLARLKRDPDAKDKIRLSDKEYEQLNWHQIKTAHPETKSVSPEVKTRILCNCLARDQSIQILGPVAVDLWAGIAFIKIEGLVATDQAIQFGYAVTWEVFQEGLNRQDQRIAASSSRD